MPSGAQETILEALTGCGLGRIEKDRSGLCPFFQPFFNPFPGRKGFAAAAAGNQHARPADRRLLLKSLPLKKVSCVLLNNLLSGLKNLFPDTPIGEKIIG